jgi:hypothetical protein
MGSPCGPGAPSTSPARSRGPSGTGRRPLAASPCPCRQRSDRQKSTRARSDGRMAWPWVCVGPDLQRIPRLARDSTGPRPSTVRRRAPGGCTIASVNTGSGDRRGGNMNGSRTGGPWSSSSPCWRRATRPTALRRAAADLDDPGAPARPRQRDGAARRRGLGLVSLAHERAPGSGRPAGRLGARRQEIDSAAALEVVGRRIRAAARALRRSSAGEAQTFWLDPCSRLRRSRCGPRRAAAAGDGAPARPRAGRRDGAAAEGRHRRGGKSGLSAQADAAGYFALQLPGKAPRPRRTSRRPRISSSAPEGFTTDRLRNVGAVRERRPLRRRPEAGQRPGRARLRAPPGQRPRGAPGRRSGRRGGSPGAGRAPTRCRRRSP